MCGYEIDWGFVRWVIEEKLRELKKFKEVAKELHHRLCTATNGGVKKLSEEEFERIINDVSKCYGRPIVEDVLMRLEVLGIIRYEEQHVVVKIACGNR